MEYSPRNTPLSGFRSATTGWLRAALLAVPLAFATPVGAQVENPAAPVGNHPSATWTKEAIEGAVAGMRAGKPLTPSTWPNGARVAVMLSWDVDNESHSLVGGVRDPLRLSEGEYGALEGMPRVFDMLDRHDIKATFFIPAATGILYPRLVEELN